MVASVSSVVVNFTRDGAFVAVIAMAVLAVVAGVLLLAQRRGNPLDRVAVVAIVLAVAGAATATTAGYRLSRDTPDASVLAAPAPSTSHGVAGAATPSVAATEPSSASAVPGHSDSPDDSRGATTSAAPVAPVAPASGSASTADSVPMQLPVGGGIDVDERRVVASFRPGDDPTVDVYSPSLPYIYATSGELYFAPYGSAATALERCRRIIESGTISFPSVTVSPTIELCFMTSEQEVAWIRVTNGSADDLGLQLRS